MPLEKSIPARTSFLGILFTAAVQVALAQPNANDPMAVSAGAIFRMGTGAAFQEGCFPPCMCPILAEQPVVGTLKLRYIGLSNSVHEYVVEDVNWHTPYVNTPDRIVGRGKYRVGSPDAITLMQHRLELDLQVGSNQVQHFDSGWAPWNPGGINITISINGMYCWDRVIRVAANQVPAAEYNRYALEQGSTFQRGCIDGMCDCAVGPEFPMQGTFGLVPLQSNPLYQLFAVVDFRGRAMNANSATGIPVSGYGLYWVGGEVAVQNQLSLVAWVADEEAQRYDSGLVIGGGQFPMIDIVTRTHTNCADTILHLVASPSDGSNVCGGIMGIGCEPGEFCKLPAGHCCCDFQGVCTPIPDACPEYVDPVCGCDGETYINPCFADAAGQSIDYWGACRNQCGPNGQDCPLGEFCKFSQGSCGPGGDPGLCTIIPGGCPDVWDPVCGCDGNTYSNECDADAAGVSIAHSGVCSAPTCSATRILDDAGLGHCGGYPLTVRIGLQPPNSATAVALEDEPPPGWTVGLISHGGVYDATNHKVKWGPLFPPFPAEVSYMATPSNDSGSPSCYFGTVSVDGINETICGESCLGPCCPRMAADLPHESCAECPVTDCNSCDASVCGDARIHLCEVVGYACAWLHGCNDDLAGMTRAAFLWRAGECYCWDEIADNWFPSQCTGFPDAGCCDHVHQLVVDGKESAHASAVLSMSLNSERLPGRSAARLVLVDLEVPMTALAAAVEVDVPVGWKVSDITDGGVWDAGSRKVKWGVFFEDLSRTVGFIVHGSGKSAATVRNGVLDGVRPEKWGGQISVDGVNQPIRVR